MISLSLSLLFPFSPFFVLAFRFSSFSSSLFSVFFFISAHSFLFHSYSFHRITFPPQQKTIQSAHCSVLLIERCSRVDETRIMNDKTSNFSTPRPPTNGRRVPGGVSVGIARRFSAKFLINRQQSAVSDSRLRFTRDRSVRRGKSGKKHTAVSTANYSAANSQLRVFR